MILHGHPARVVSLNALLCLVPPAGRSSKYILILCVSATQAYGWPLVIRLAGCATGTVPMTELAMCGSWRVCQGPGILHPLIDPWRVCHNCSFVTPIESLAVPSSSRCERELDPVQFLYELTLCLGYSHTPEFLLRDKAMLFIRYPVLRPTRQITSMEIFSTTWGIPV